jgi:two-component system, NtrC family, sensor kinase
MGQARKGLGRKAGRRKAAVSPRRREAESKTPGQSKSRVVRAGADKNQNAEVTRLARELNEALAQQSASSDVLAVINSSPGNLAPVFEAIVDKALKICDAGFGGLWMVEGELARPAATRNVPKAYSKFLMRQALPLTAAFGSGIEDKPFNHVTDLSKTESYRRRLSLTVASVELGGIRSYLAVPLRDGCALTGVLSVYRKEVRPFSARQIALLQGFAMQAEIAMKNARLLKETQEGLKRQTATSDILKVIANSPSNVQPVFEAMLDKAISLCGAKFGSLFLYDGKGFAVAADQNLPREYAKAVRGRSFSPEANAGFRFVVEKKSTLHVPDMFADASYARGEAVRKAAVELGGVRSLIAVPLLKRGKLIGNFSIYKKDPGGFAENQVALVENFASQAVIAIENARLFNETREALARQTAAADVLRIISSSPRDLGPVFEAMLGNAMRICDAKFGHILLYDGERFHATHLHDVPKAYRAFWDEHGPIHPSPDTGLGRLARTRQLIHIPDLKADPAYAAGEPLRIVTVDLAGARSFLAVPMLKETGLVGAIVIYRQEVQPFTDDQIALVENFASQAVIAFENARLFNETQEALERQIATAEVLRIISSSPRDLEPVFTAILENATRLCEAKFGHLFLSEEDDFRVVALQSAAANYPDWLKRGQKLAPLDNPHGPLAQLARSKKVVHIADLAAEQAYIEGNARMVALVESSGARTFLGVPMFKEGALIGAIAIYRQEVRPFTDEQIALVENFASQAVIAIENARLFNETQESLQQQTATADVLKVISRSAFDLDAVLGTLVESAARLCGAERGILFLRKGNECHVANVYGFSPELEAFARVHPIPIDGASTTARAAASGIAVQTVDLLADPSLNEVARQYQKLGGHRTNLGVPLKRNGEIIGVFTLTRQIVRAFTDKQIELVQTFADQAVIAIENVRLFDEVQARTRDLEESLQHQTATAEVLKVISRSAFDLQTVLDTLVESAVTLSGARTGTIFQKRGDLYHLTADYGYSPEMQEYGRAHPLAPGLDSNVGRTSLTAAVVQIPDVLADPHWKAHGYQRVGNFRAMLGIPIIREGTVEGVFSLAKPETGMFGPRQVELVQTFADQASIAIENARLFDEVQAKTRDLSESLQQQTATAEVLKVITRSTFNLQAVLDTLVESATRLCDAQDALIFLPEGNVYRAAARFGFTPEYHAYIGSNPIRIDRGSVVGRTVIDKQLVHISDVLADPDYSRFDAQKIAGYRAVLGAPMLREGNVVGVIFLTRTRPEPFTEKQIELVKTFADQAIIAIENTRLFDEVQAKTRDLEESLRQQTATADVLKIISRSAFDLQRVLSTLTESAARLCDADYSWLFQRDGEFFRFVASFGESPEVHAQLRSYFQPLRVPVDRSSVTGRTALEGRVIHIPDVLADPEYTWSEAQKIGGYRAALGAPLLREGNVVGVFFVANKLPQPFTAKQIELVTTFADQAVIAIENARLFDEVQAKTRDLTESLQQQTATAEVLKVISSSSGDLKPVFDSILANATQICDARFGILFLSEGDVVRVVATHGVTAEYAEARRREPIIVPGEGTTLQLASSTRRPVQIADIRAEPAYLNDPRRFAILDLAGARTIMGVPIVMEDKLVGIINIYRTEVRPFTDKQVELVKNFAAQAVIAIENSRLLSELRESLQRQTATADVLKTISRSTFDLPAVLHALVQTAAQLCDADKGTITRQKDGAFYRAESCGFSDDFMNYVRDVPVVVDRHTATGRALLEGVVIHIPDVEKDLEYSFGDGPRLGDYRALLGVPMLREGVPIGVITLTRTEPRGFTDKQIELAATFADQAAIAIQNVRLFNETREALERQTATAEILQVIASSPSDVQPVFDAIATRANSLIGGFSSTVFRFSDGMAHLKAFTPTTPKADEVLKSTFPRPVADFQPFQMAQAGKVTQIPDTEAPTYELKEIARARGYRSMLFAPLMNKDVSIGFIAVTRVQPGNFSEHHVQLLRTFADQAVIAIENARLFDEVQARTRELAKSLDDLRAAQDRLVQTEKLASLGQLTAGIAHEIKNPLNFVNNFSALSAELVDEMDGVLEAARLEDEKRTELDEIRKLLKSNLEKVVQHGKRADSIVKNMLLHSRSGSGERRPVEINAIIDESLNLAYHGARAEKQGFNITLERDFDPSAGIADVYPQEITRVLLNLVSNGFYAATKRAIEAGNGFEPRLKAATKSLGDMVEIRIRDNGTGIPPDIREKIFNPFFTTKPAGEGTGLGLSMSHDIVVKQHGGTIDIATEPGAFTEFIITLPRTMIQPGAGEPKN